MKIGNPFKKKKTGFRRSRSYVKTNFKVLITFILLITVFYGSKNVIAHDVECRSTSGECRLELNSRLSETTRKPMTTSMIEVHKILAKDPYIKKYGMNFVWPDIISVIVEQKKASCSASLKGSEHIALIDKEGYILEYVKSSDLPHVTSSSIRGSVGEKIDAETYFSCQMLAHLDYHYHIRNAEQQKNGLYVKKDELTVILPKTGDIDFLIGSMDIIFSRLKQESKDSRIETSNSFSELDLRFKNPVLR